MTLILFDQQWRCNMTIDVQTQTVNNGWLLFICLPHLGRHERRARRPIYFAGIKIIRNSRFPNSTPRGFVFRLVAELSTFWFLEINLRDGLQKCFLSLERSEAAVERQNKTSMIFSSLVSQSHLLRSSIVCHVQLWHSDDALELCVSVEIFWEPLSQIKRRSRSVQIPRLWRWCIDDWCSKHCRRERKAKQTSLGYFFCWNI